MSNLLWGIFEIAVNFYQGFILVFFTYVYLSDKKGRSFFKSPGIFFGIGLSVAISIMNRIIVFEHLYALIYTGIILLYALINLNGSFLKKLFTSFFLSLVVSLITSFVANFSAVLFGKDLYMILSENSIERFLAMTVAQLVLLYCVIFSIKLLKTDNENGGLLKTEWLLILSVLIISIIICAFLNLISLTHPLYSERKYTVIAFAGIILINIAVCYLVVDLSKKNIAVRENEALKLAQEYSRQYAKNAEIEYDVLRKLRHDFKDNFSVVHTLLKNNNVELAIKHIENNIGALSETEIFIRTNNDIVNAVINAKLSTAKSFGIDSTCLSVMDFDGIDDLDLCRLLSNMLENAITACVSIKEGEKRIYLKITDDEYNYMFNLKNTIESSVVENNCNLETTKPEKKLHGFGTKIIKDISMKYNGRCDFYEEDGCFCCNVILSK